MSKTNVLLADDHNIVLDGLEVVLSQEEDLSIVGKANNGQQVLDFLQDNKVDVVVMDINMPEMDGLTCSKHIKKKYPDTKIVILTMYPQKSFVEEIIKIGIDGCLLKNNTGTELKQAIDRVVSGKKYYDLIDSFSSDEKEVVTFDLSEREKEIIKYLAKGMTSNEIADLLFISEHTVRTHRKNMLKKAGLSNTTMLIQYATKNNLI